MSEAATTSDLLFHRDLPSPVGPLRLIADASFLRALLWGPDDLARCRLRSLPVLKPHPVLERAELQLTEYFAGRRLRFDLPLQAEGTAFQRRVWDALALIPYGETRSYGQIAHDIGSPQSARAVGLANRCNPHSIVVPCHRVIGANGKLVGFAGGIAAKMTLLEHEQRVLATHQRVQV